MPDLKLLNVVNSASKQRADIEMTIYSDGTFANGPAMVTNRDRAIQDVVRGLLTQLGSNPLAPGFGTNLNKYLHARKVSDVSAQLTAEVQYMLSYLGMFNINEVTAEQILRLTKLEAQDGTNQIQLKMEVQTGGRQNASISL